MYRPFLPFRQKAFRRTPYMYTTCKPQLPQKRTRERTHRRHRPAQDWNGKPLVTKRSRPSRPGFTTLALCTPVLASIVGVRLHIYMPTSSLAKKAAGENDACVRLTPFVENYVSKTLNLRRQAAPVSGSRYGLCVMACVPRRVSASRHPLLS